MGVHKENIWLLLSKASENTYNNKITIRTAKLQVVNNKLDEMLLTMYKEETDISMMTETWMKDMRRQ